jgi:hypothetical protein
LSFNLPQNRRFVWALSAFLLCAVAGNAQSKSFVFKSLSGDEVSVRKSLDSEKEGSFYKYLSDVAWVMGPADAANAALSLEHRKLDSSNKERFVELSIRRALITNSPEGQAAILSSACAVDGGLCDRLRVVVQGVADTRLVAPGNQLPEALTQGLPVSPGAYPPSHFH